MGVLQKLVLSLVSGKGNKTQGGSAEEKMTLGQITPARSPSEP